MTETTSDDSGQVQHVSARHIEIVWQDGPVLENGEGVNGVQAEEVIEHVLEYLRSLNVPPLNTRETSLAITDLESAQNWLRRRTADREARGVEGTNQP